MKRFALIIPILQIIICYSCGQATPKNKEFESFCSKFQNIEFPVEHITSETIKKERYDNPISKEEIKKYLSDKESFFYGAVDRDGYAPYKYYYGNKFARNENIICLLYPASKYGKQFLLATYLTDGTLIDSLTVGSYLVDYLGTITQDFTINSEYELYVEKVDAIIEKRSKYDSIEKRIVAALYKGSLSMKKYQINEQGKIVYQKEENKTGLLNIVNDKIIWIE